MLMGFFAGSSLCFAVKLDLPIRLFYITSLKGNHVKISTFFFNVYIILVQLGYDSHTFYPFSPEIFGKLFARKAADTVP